MVICDSSHGGNRKTFGVVTSTYPRGTLGTVASLLAATLYRSYYDLEEHIIA